jgi:hypothetical protein
MFRGKHISILLFLEENTYQYYCFTVNRNLTKKKEKKCELQEILTTFILVFHQFNPCGIKIINSHDKYRTLTWKIRLISLLAMLFLLITN